MMEYLKTGAEFVHGLADYPFLAKVLFIITVSLMIASAVVLIYVPKIEPVNKWLPASDESTLKKFVPQDMLQNLEDKKQKENDLTRNLQNLSSGALLGKNSSPGSDLRLEVQSAQLERAQQQQLVETHIHTRLLTGEILTRGIPNEAPPHDAKPINIQRAQWQYLLFSVDGRALDSKGETIYKALEIGKSR